MQHFLDFERPIAILENKLNELRNLDSDTGLNIAQEIGNLQTRIQSELKQTYKKLGPWEKIQVARHPNRPKILEIIKQLFKDFVQLAGDRNYSEDFSIIGGIGKFENQSVVIIGTEKGSTTDERIIRNFGMVRPEGYRKSIRLMQMANKFNLPLISFIDTAGAYPGKGAEERGQAEAIARSIQSCINLEVPFISIIVGEGGSGGAIALATSNRVLMFEHAVYSVISPEGCASILWRDSSKVKLAAESLKLTAQDLKNFGIIDEIIPEPLGGAHRDIELSINNIKTSVIYHLEKLKHLSSEELKTERANKYLSIGTSL